MNGYRERYRGQLARWNTHTPTRLRVVGGMDRRPPKRVDPPVVAPPQCTANQCGGAAAWAIRAREQPVLAGQRPLRTRTRSRPLRSDERVGA